MKEVFINPKDFDFHLNLARTKAEQIQKPVDFTIQKNLFCRVSPKSGNGSFTVRAPKKKVIGYTSNMSVEDAIKAASEIFSNEVQKIVAPKEKTSFLDSIKINASTIVYGIVCSIWICLIIGFIAFVLKVVGLV